MSRNINIFSMPYNESIIRDSDKALQVIDVLTHHRNDLVVLPEEVNVYGLPMKDWSSVAQPIPGPITDAFAQLAQKGYMYVVLPQLEKLGNHYFNSAPLIDRKGRIAGVYRKRYPFPPELDIGTLPGDGPCVFTTDFGRVGFLICFDVNYPEAGERLANEGAEFVLFPSMFNGGLLLQSLALHGGFYVLSATASLQNVLIDPLGRVIKQSREEPLAASVNLDYAVIHLDFQAEKIEQGTKLFGKGVTFDIDHDLGRALVTCNREDLHMPEIMERLGLITCREYLRQSEERIRKARPPLNGTIP